MKKQRIVVALGGNALGNTPEKQEQAVVYAAKAAAGLIKAGHELVIGHGNGPQVGMIHLALNDYGGHQKEPFVMPFPECTAMSQGYIGFHLQRALQKEMDESAIKSMAVSIVTQVCVDPDDPAFLSPDKPIGSFCTKQEAEKAAKEEGYTFMEDAGRGYRRVVPSPQPKEIVEIEAVRRMLDSGLTVITVGGGGIPVVRTNDGLKGIDAVIDKDRASEKLAEDVGADVLLILTAVGRVCLNYGKEDETPLESLSASEAERYLKEGHFAPGSMRPKMEAAIRFVRSSPGRKAVITSLECAEKALSEGAGTHVLADEDVITNA
ncbi:MAG: carbamate kinase [Lachnospiraceae bacterium]|nr:carbamate kinase [Lachnospiraceae bacterium]